MKQAVQAENTLLQKSEIAVELDYMTNNRIQPDYNNSSYSINEIPSHVSL